MQRLDLINRGNQGPSLGQQPVHLIPFDLIGSENRQYIVDVRGAHDVGSEYLLAIVSELAPPATGARNRPIAHVIAKAGKRLVTLAENHTPNLWHLLWQATSGIAKRGDIGGDLPGVGM